MLKAMRGSGILMHISSLPSEFGIGTLGREAYEFVDFLSETGQKYWQVLPIGPTAYGDSPYQSPSAFAGNPYFIDLPTLEEEGLLKREEYASLPFGNDPDHVDFGAVYYYRQMVFNIVSERFSEEKYPEFAAFCEENKFWLDDYAIFMAIKDNNGGKCWNEFPEGLKYRKEKDLESAFQTFSNYVKKYKILQFFFFRQWKKLKEYANSKNVKMFGDMPIYVAYDSSDVWASTSLFELDSELMPKRVAGCPPDAFSELGQRWGNPLYEWKKQKDEVFSWWFDRIEHATSFFDLVRIDHFRAFADYYAIPAGEETAVNGEWELGPGIEFFDKLRERIGDVNIVAEDLGMLTPAVTDLLRDTGFPGMKVLQFAFDGNDNNLYQPHNYIKNCVVYIGTHDNDTLCGWLKSARPETLMRVNKYFRVSDRREDTATEIINGALASVGNTVIITVQDLLKLGTEARMNTPATDRNNWTFRVEKDYISKIDTSYLKDATVLYFR